MYSVSKVMQVLLDHGFKRDDDKKDHGYLYCHPDGRRTTVKENSKNGTIPKSTFFKIQKQTGIKFNNF